LAGRGRGFEGEVRLLAGFGGLRPGAGFMSAGEKAAEKRPLAGALNVGSHANGRAGFNADVSGEKQMASGAARGGV
jgi:hypothetical protein